MADGAQPAREGRVGNCGGQPSVTSCISGGGDRVGLDLEGKRQGSVHSTRFRPKGQGQLRAVGWKRGRQLFSGWDRLTYCSVLTGPKWKTSVKLALLGERNQSLPSGGGSNGEPRDSGDKEGRTPVPLAGTAEGLKGLRIFLVWAALSLSDVPTFRPQGIGIPKPPPLVEWTRRLPHGPRGSRPDILEGCDLTSAAPLVDLSYYLPARHLGFLKSGST